MRLTWKQILYRVLQFEIGETGICASDMIFCFSISKERTK